MDNYDKARLWAEKHLEEHGRKRWSVDERDALADAFVSVVAKTGGKWKAWKAPAKKQKHQHDDAIIECLKLRNMTVAQIIFRIGITDEMAKSATQRMRKAGVIKPEGRESRATIYTLA